MSINFKALLLSAFILPGLGQLYKGEKIKGAIIICLVNIFLLAALFLVLQGAGQIIAGKAGVADVNSILEALSTKNTSARWLLSAFFGIWIFGVIDAAKK